MNNELKTKISAAILALVAAGVPVREAIDQVLGAGTSEALIGEIYTALRGVRS